MGKFLHSFEYLKMGMFCVIFSVIGILYASYASATDFYIAFPQNGGTVSKLNTYIAAEEETSVNVESLLVNISATHKLSSATGLKLSFPVSLMLNGSTVESKGLRISSLKNINVAVTTDSECCGSEGYNALPFSRLGTEYLVTGMYNSSLVVIATEDETRVNITKRFSGEIIFNGSSYHYGDIINVTLNRLQTLQILVKGGYLIGSTIISDKPVGIVSGQYYGSLSLNSQSKFDFNHMIEYIPQMKNLGTVFIVPPIVNATYMRLVVFSAENDTAIKITTVRFQSERIVRRYSSAILTVRGNKPYVIRSNNPVILIQYPHGVNIFMTYIPDVDKYSNHVTYYVPHNYTSFMAIIVEAIMVDGIRIDDTPIQSMIYRTDTLIDEFTFYIVITVSVDPGNHVIRHVDTNAKFGLIAYGFNVVSSYGFPVSMD